MKKNNITEAIGIIVTIVGIAVMIGWFLDIGILKSILPGWVTMKVTTALSFIMTGIMLYFIARFRKGSRELAGVVIPVASMVILLLMATLFASTVTGTSVGVEELFVKEAEGAVKTLVPGRPAIPTAINFILIAMAGFFTILDVKVLRHIAAIFGVLVGVIGAVAVAGYIVDQPLLYYFVQGKSAAMAMHTAILFVLIGVGLIFTESDE